MVNLTFSKTKDGLFTCGTVTSSEPFFKQVEGSVISVIQPGSAGCYHPVFFSRGNASLCYSLQEALDLLQMVGFTLEDKVGFKVF